MIRGILKNGFEYEIDDHVIDDMRFVDALSELDEDPLQFSTVVRMLLGKEQRNRLYKHIQEEDGRIPPEKMAGIIEEILTNSQSNELKN